MKIETLQQLVDAMTALVGTEGAHRYWTVNCEYANHATPMVRWNLYHEDYPATNGVETAQEAFDNFRILWDKKNGKKKKTSIKKELAKVGKGPNLKIVGGKTKGVLK